jgi:erythromycin esterase-like protein
VDVAIVAVTAAQKEFAWWRTTDSYNARDAGMADILQRMWALRAPDAKVAVFAHNVHLLRDTEAIDSTDVRWKGMGAWLDEALGDDYVVLAQLCSETTYNWFGKHLHTVTASADSYEAAIESLSDRDALVVDVRAAAEAGVLPEGPIEFGSPDVGVARPVDHMNAAFWVKSSPEMEVWDDF